MAGDPKLLGGKTDAIDNDPLLTPGAGRQATEYVA